MKHINLFEKFMGSTEDEFTVEYARKNDKNVYNYIVKLINAKSHHNPDDIERLINDAVDKNEISDKEHEIMLKYLKSDGREMLEMKTVNEQKWEFVKYKHNDNPDLEEVVKQAATAMGENPDNMYVLKRIDRWYHEQDEETTAKTIKDITGSAEYELNKVFTHNNTKFYVTSDGENLYVLSNEGVVLKEDEVKTLVMTKEKAKEMLQYLDKNGEHALVKEYKGKVTDSDISGIIGAWATTTKSLDDAVEEYWQRHKKIYNITETLRIKLFKHF